jgi:hypothetical protein
LNIMKPINPNQPTIEMRYRTILILWFAIAMSVLMFLVLTQFTPNRENGDLKLSLILNGAGIVPLGLSFLLKQRILEQAVAQQRLDLVQVAYVLAFALCEMAALLGLMDHFLSGSRYYYFGFLIGGLGLLLHFPRKQHLLDASQQRF